MQVKTCHECGLTQKTGITASRSEPCRVQCCRCRSTLIKYQPKFAARALGYAISGLVFLVIAASFSFLTLTAAGRAQSITLWSGVETVWVQGYPLLAVIVGLQIVLMPALLMLLVIYLLLPYHLGLKPPAIGSRLGALLQHMAAWNMADVFLIGVLVALVKLSAMAVVLPGMSFIAYCGFCICLVLALTNIDYHTLLQWLGRTSHSSHSLPDKRSLQRCWALLLTAAICFIPANLLPITITVKAGETLPGTLMDGVITLWGMGSWPVASVIFFASIFVPLAKIFSLTYLCLSVQLGMTRRQLERTSLYRLTEFFGRWSMIDVFVVAILVSLVQFGNLVAFYVGPAVVAFFAVVILTMLAAESFDPRLIWNPAPEAGSEKST
ncbi:paraquat-inducible protein A [Endozoicomonadaceae bacterium StTr2]